MDFTQIAEKYKSISLVQKSAAEILLRLLDISPEDDVLDLGCGTGNLTKNIRSLTSGTIIGIDPSEGMIKEAMQQYQHLNIIFKRQGAEEIIFKGRFNIIFCNSAFQWFGALDRSIRNCYNALKENGKIGIQAPAKKNYSPNFIEAIHNVQNDPRTKHIFQHFKNPWFFCESVDQYKSLFEKQKFIVPFAEIQYIEQCYTSEEVFQVFMSGASNGYLNQYFYDIQIDKKYIDTFKDIVKQTFLSQAGSDGKVNLAFNRIFLIAVKRRQEE